jgi:hypothetical protein
MVWRQQTNLFQEVMWMIKKMCQVSTGLATLAVAASAVAADQATRQMSVDQGPDSVFSEPVDQVFSELRGAEATDENGRVGNELVFWGYRLADGRNVYLAACAMIENVDCEARKELVCPGAMQVIADKTQAGLVRRLHCESIAVVGVGDTRPGCSDTEALLELSVSLLQCD